MMSPELLKNYSVRWTGVLVPPVTGEYLIGFTGQDGYRVWLDGQLATEDWNIHHPASTLTKKLRLERDHPYPIRIEYFQDIRSAEARFIWSLPDQGGLEALEAARAADLVVSRAGAGTLSEVSAIGVPMVLIPYPFAGGHQRLNVAPYESAGAAVVIPDEEADGGRLVGVLGRAPTGQAMLYRSVGGDVSGWPIFDAAAPVLPGFAAPPEFVF